MDKYLKKRQSAEKSSDSSSESDNLASVSVSGRKKHCPNRKYVDSYLKYGFINVGPDNCQKPQCVICSEVLANASMKPSKLLRHARTKHADTLEKPIEFFKRKGDDLKKQKFRFSETVSLNSAALKASFDVSLRISKAKKPHTIGESLILPSVIHIVKVVCGEKFVSKVRTVPLSNNCVSRRITDMSADVQEQLIELLQISKNFALQLDESTDVSNCAMLLVYVRFIQIVQGMVSEEFLFCNELPTRTTGEEVFNVLDNFVTENGLELANCVGITTDGAAAMTGKRDGLVQRVKNVAPKAVSYHCFIHREALAAKELSEELHEVLQTAVKMVNFIKASALNSRMFQALCAEMGQNINICCFILLSRGRVLLRLFELKSEVHMFLADKKSLLATHLVDQNWLYKLSYLVDMFGFLNDLNMGL